MEEIILRVCLLPMQWRYRLIFAAPVSDESVSNACVLSDVVAPASDVSVPNVCASCDVSTFNCEDSAAGNLRACQSLKIHCARFIAA